MRCFKCRKKMDYEEKQYYKEKKRKFLSKKDVVGDLLLFEGYFDYLELNPLCRQHRE